MNDFWSIIVIVSIFYGFIAFGAFRSPMKSLYVLVMLGGIAI